MRKPKHNLTEVEAGILAELQSGKGLSDALSPLIKRVMEAALDGEMDHHLCDVEVGENRRNGISKKQVKSSSGSFELEVPRDRNSEFEPQIIKKRQTLLTDDLDSKILNLYANGMSYADIRSNLEEIYQVEISNGAISKITDRLLPELKEWRERPLQSVYAVVYLDAIHFKMRVDGRVSETAVYTLLGIDSDGYKEILGLYLGEVEGASYWASVLASLKERGVEDILIACVDGLKGFPDAIASLFPQCEIQLCIIHQIRNSMRYVASKDQKAVMVDLKLIYRAADKTSAEENLELLEEKWGKKYPLVIRSWQNNWPELSTLFKYDHHVRRLIYTTNAVEGLHRMVRKYTKSKGAFTSQAALEKLVYCAYKKAMKKWTMQLANWALIVSQLEIHFPKRLSLKIK